MHAICDGAVIARCTVRRVRGRLLVEVDGRRRAHARGAMVARGAWRVATLYIYGVRGVYPSQRRRGEGGAPNVGKRSLRRTRDGFNYQLCHAEMTIGSFMQ